MPAASTIRRALNRYAYVNGSPLGATDRSGLDPLFDITMVWDSTSATDATLASGFIAYAGPLAFGLDIFEFGKDLGWWATGPQFTGNVAASQSGKNVPNAPQDGFANCGGCLAQGIFHGEGQPYWGGANRVVTDAAIGYWGAVGVGLSGGTLIGATTGLTTLGLEAPTGIANGYLWTGPRSEAIASQLGTTLNDTIYGEAALEATSGLGQTAGTPRWLTKHRSGPLWRRVEFSWAMSPLRTT